MTMSDEYWVVAQDGKEYGPADITRLIQWVREGRVIAGTLVRKGSDAPCEARTLAELAGMFGVTGETVPGGSPGAAPVVVADEFRVWGFIGQAWDLVRPHWLVFGGMFFVLEAICMVPHVGWLAWLFLSPAIMVGIWRAVLGTIAGRPPQMGMMFEGFDRFLDAFLGHLVGLVLIGLASLLLIVPGIILAVTWCFFYPVLVESRLGFWESLRESAEITRGYRWELFLLALAGIPIILLGLLAACVGVFISLAVMTMAFALAYRFCVERRRRRAAVPA